MADPQTDPNADIGAFLSKQGYGGATPTEQVLSGSQKITDTEIAAIDKGQADRKAALGSIEHMKWPAQPRLQNIPQAPKLQYDDPMKALQSPAIVLAALGSLFTRHPMKVVMDSASAMIQANIAGQKDKFKEERANFQEALEVATNQNKVELERYHAAWESAHNNLEIAKLKMMEVANSTKDELMKAGLQQGTLDNVFKIMEAREKASSHLAEVKQKLAEEDRRAAETERHNKAIEDLRRQSMAPGGEADIKRRHQEEIERHNKVMEGFAQSRLEGGGELSKETMSEMADQYLAGDKSVFTNLGRGAQGSKNITALRENIAQKMQAQGLSGADIATKLAEFEGLKAGERAIGTRGANVEIAANEAYNMLDLAHQASVAVPRSKWVPINKALQAYERGSSDPALAKFAAANLSLINAYARAVSPVGAPTISDKDHAREVLSTAMGPASYDAVLDQLAQEIEAAKAAPRQVKKQLREGDSGKAAAPAKEKTAAPEGWSIKRVD